MQTNAPNTLKALNKKNGLTGEKNKNLKIDGKGVLMMNTNNRSYRLDAIFKYIQECKYVTLKELSEQFGVSIRTVERDVHRIQQEYPQILMRQGNTGGVFWEDGVDE